MKLPFSGGTALACALVLAGFTGTLLGSLPPLGHQAWGSLQSWWTLQRFHQAEADLDLPALLELGESYLEQTGRGEILEFAAYRVGYGASGPSMNRLPEDALFWAQTGLEPLLTHAEVLPEPWTALHTQAYILVDRIFPQTLDRQDLLLAVEATHDRLAAGGGLYPVGPNLHRAYRDYLRNPADARNAFLIKYLSQDLVEEAEAAVDQPR